MNKKDTKKESLEFDKDLLPKNLSERYSKKSN